MRCCIKCFSDPVLKEEINRHGRKGKCSFCENQDTLVVTPRRLNMFFSPAIRRCETLENVEKWIYEESELPYLSDLAQDLPSLIEKTLYARIFSKRLKKSVKCALLDAIRGTKSPSRKSSNKWLSNHDWLPATECGVKYLENFTPDDHWYVFEQAIKRKRRYILEQDHDPRWWLKDLLPRLALDVSGGKKYWRARLTTVKRPYRFQEMGPPPAIITKHGRMNTEGIPILYLSESLHTAVSEVRPYFGASVSVVCLQTTQPFKVIDLTSKLHSLSPFSDADIDRLWMQRNFLQILNERLSQPVSPFDSSSEYLPTQYIAEFIKDLGFNGIIYTSSYSRKHRNLAFFDIDHWQTSFHLADCPRLFRVAKTSITVTEEMVDHESYEAETKKTLEASRREPLD